MAYFLRFFSADPSDDPSDQLHKESEDQNQQQDDNDYDDNDPDCKAVGIFDAGPDSVIILHYFAALRSTVVGGQIADAVTVRILHAMAAQALSSLPFA